MFKVCQYVTYNDKVLKCLMQVNVKDAQTTLQKTITWTKKINRSRQEWEKACIECGLSLQKIKTLIKTRFASNIIMFERPWNSSKLSSIVMEGKRILFYNKEFQRPKCGLLQKQNYFYLKPYGNSLCHESIPRSLVIVRCFDYYHYTNYINLQFEMAKMF
jgi:hypothetical protein